MIDAILTNSMLAEVSREMLGRTLHGDRLAGVCVNADGGDLAYRFAPTVP